MISEVQGQLFKMRVKQGTPIAYTLELGETHVDMNSLIGKEIQLHWTGKIQCISCGSNIKKSFNQGFCFSCFSNSPESAECIIRPELCRAHLGEGRDVEWEERNHNQPHVVYLAATDVVKVGVTRATQIPTRWIDQGAQAAIKLAETPNRYLAGILEVALKDHFSDKTNWRKMLKNECDDTIDLIDEKWKLEDLLPADLTVYFSEDDAVEEFDYPVLEYPTTLNSLSFDKQPLIQGTLKGIKGQYLFFDNGRVLNLRKHTGYLISLSY